MTRLRARFSNEHGFAIVYTAVALTSLLLITGLAVDGGRAYAVKAQLTKAVDGAALGAARSLNSGNPEQEAAKIFRANFPPGYLGTSSTTDPTQDANFFRLETIAETGVNVVTVTAEARLPATFMRLANFEELAVSSTGEATRRMVDLSLVIDVSGSIGGAWGAVNDAAELFVSNFDTAADRLSLVLFSHGAGVAYPMPASRGFNLNAMLAAIPEGLPGGGTNMVEGLYRGWDELRSVPSGQQSGLRVIVLFTDGASNAVPGMWDASGVAKSLRTWDFPERNDPEDQTHDFPRIEGLFNTQVAANQTPNFWNALRWNRDDAIHPSARWMLPNSTHAWHRSSGIPASFPMQSATLRVNGQPQSSPSRRGLLGWNETQGAYPAHTRNLNNAARNLVEIIANAAREDDDGDYPIRIFAIGMGRLLQLQLGTMPETPESILMRVANDTDSPDHNDDQLAGQYYYAPTAADVGPAFQQLQNQIVRLTK